MEDKLKENIIFQNEELGKINHGILGMKNEYEKHNPSFKLCIKEKLNEIDDYIKQMLILSNFRERVQFERSKTIQNYFGNLLFV